LLFRIKCGEVFAVGFYGWSLPFDTQNHSTIYLVKLAIMLVNVQPRADYAKKVYVVSICVEESL